MSSLHARRFAVPTSALLFALLLGLGCESPPDSLDHDPGPPPQLRPRVMDVAPRPGDIRLNNEISPEDAEKLGIEPGAAADDDDDESAAK